MNEKKECVLCSKSITPSRWSQHVNSKSHQEHSRKQSRSLTPDVEPEVPELSGEEDGVLDDDSTETDSSYTSGSESISD